MQAAAHGRLMKRARAGLPPVAAVAQCRTPLALAVWVAIASISGGDKQS